MNPTLARHAMHKPALITDEDLRSSKEELLAVVEEIDATLTVMKRKQCGDLYSFHVASLTARDGALRKLSAFVKALSESKRRLQSGKPISPNETKGTLRSEPEPARRARPAKAIATQPKTSVKVAEDDSVYDILRTALSAMSPEVKKRVAESLMHDDQPATGKKSKSSPR